MNALTTGSGYGGLDMAVSAVLGARLAWVADNDPGAARILAHRQPGVPNLGDLTAVDWATVAPVDILTAGFPCQDLSYAGWVTDVPDLTRNQQLHALGNGVVPAQAAAALHTLLPATGHAMEPAA